MTLVDPVTTLLTYMQKLLFFNAIPKKYRRWKKTWETLDNVLLRKTSKSSPDAIQINDKLSTDKTGMADPFNTYFSTICATSEIDNPNNVPSHDVYLNNLTEAEFNFEQIDNMTVLHYINKLKPSHSCGHDNISSNVLKIIAMEVSPCLTLIINQVLSTGQFPKNLKTAKVIPIHKTGDKIINEKLSTQFHITSSIEDY